MTITRAIRGAAAALVMAAAAAGTADAQGAGQLVGRVTDGVGRAVEQAVVTVAAEGVAARAPGWTAASGETGGFGFAALPAGSYRVRVERAGFEPREERVTVRPGERRTVVVRLREAARRVRGAEPGRRQR